MFVPTGKFDTLMFKLKCHSEIKHKVKPSELVIAWPDCLHSMIHYAATGSVTGRGHGGPRIEGF